MLIQQSETIWFKDHEKNKEEALTLNLLEHINHIKCNYACEVEFLTMEIRIGKGWKIYNSPRISKPCNL